MAPRIPEKELTAIEEVVHRHPDGVTTREIAAALAPELPRRTLQYRLKHLVNAGRIDQEGRGRGTLYRPSAAKAHGRATIGVADSAEAEVAVPVSKGGAEIRSYLRRPSAARNPAGYNREFLDSYRPNETAWFSAKERAHLAKIGRPNSQILNRLLIDLSWNSSRLEGNTYSLLDTRRLIEFGEEAEGKERLETQMILNHKDAIEFLVDMTDDAGFNRATILNLHAILANNLLPDETAAGRLRHIAVGIEKSAFYPLEVPQLIAECFDQLLATAAAIADPFEQALFVMAQLPYLQPFDDVNKRVSRLAANIPFIRDNLSPLSFTDVPHAVYTDALLGVYELNRIDLLRDVFIWAYEKSAARYAAVRQSLGEPDPFKLRYRDALLQIVGEVVRQRMGRKTAFAHIASWAKANIASPDRERFREIAENELLSLHEGNYARYRVRPAEFGAWRRVWMV